MSASVRLLEITMALKPGQAIDVPHQLIADAAVDDFPMLDRMHGARPEDIKAFIEKVGENWEVEITEKFGRGKWRVYRPVSRTTTEPT